MAVEQYIAEAESAVARLEEKLAEIDAGELLVAAEQEEKLRDILDVLQMQAEFQELADGVQLNTTAPATRKAIADAKTAVNDWRENTLARFRADPATLAVLSETAQRLAEMNAILDDAAASWTNIISRLSDQEKFTPAQIAEAKQLSKDTAFYRRRFGNMRRYLSEQGATASFGKSENMAAEVDRVWRSARNFLEEIGGGPPIFHAQEATLGEIRNLRNSIAFNRNNLSLSAVAHARGLFSAALIAIAQPLGVCHFMLYLSKKSRQKASGFTRTHLFEVRLGQVGGSALSLDRWAERVASFLQRPVGEVRQEANRRLRQGRKDLTPANVRQKLGQMLVAADRGASWPEVWDQVNRGRRETVAWGSPLLVHHNSREVYLPVPPALVAEAQAWSDGLRRKAA